MARGADDDRHRTMPHIQSCTHTGREDPGLMAPRTTIVAWIGVKLAKHPKHTTAHGEHKDGVAEL